MKKQFVICSLMALVGTLPAQNHYALPTEITEPEMMTDSECLVQMQNGSIQLCDSMISYYNGTLNSKQENTYDSRGNCTSSSFFKYSDTDNSWILNNREEFIFDEDSHLMVHISSNFKQEYTYNDKWLEVCCYRYEMLDNIWFCISKEEHSYDDKDRCTLYASYIWMEGEWQISYQRETTYDAMGHIASEAYKYYNNIQGTVTVMGSKSEFTYSSYGQLTEQTYYNWDTLLNQWVGGYKYMYSYDANGNETCYTSCNWDQQQNIWVNSIHDEYSYDSYGNQTGIISYIWENDEWVVSSESMDNLTFDDNGNIICKIGYRRNLQSGEWQKISKHEYTYDDHGNMLCDVYLRLADEAVAGGSKDEYSYDAMGLQINHTHYTMRKGEWAIQQITDHSYDSDGRETSYASYDEKMISNEPYVLNINLSDDPITDNLDQQGLLFTGQNYAVNALYADQYVSGHNFDEAEEDQQPVLLWENDGTHGEIMWSGEYRFASTDHITGQEIYAFPNEDWNRIKEGRIRVDIECPNNATVIITTGLWTAYYGGHSNCFDLVQTDSDGSKYIILNLFNDGYLYNLIDQEDLLFTGIGYRVMRISSLGTPSNHDDELLEVTEDGYWKRHYLWKNNGQGDVSWSNTYLFNSQENATGNELATLSAEDWEIVKHGDFKAKLAVYDQNNTILHITTGWKTDIWTGNAFTIASDLVSGGPLYVLAGNEKHDQTYDENGNLTCDNRYVWNGDDWNISWSYVYYYSSHTDDIHQILQELRPRVSKQMRNGQVFIVVGDKTYNLEGELVK